MDSNRTDPRTGKRYRIMTAAEYFEKQNVPVTRNELGEVLQLTVHNVRCRTWHGRLIRFLAWGLHMKRLESRWRPKSSIKLYLDG